MLKSRRGRQLHQSETFEKSRNSLRNQRVSAVTLSRDLPSSPIFNHVSITRIGAALLASLIASACGYPITPTAPEPTAAAAPVLRQVAWIELIAGEPDFLSARAVINAMAKDASGYVIQDAEITCSAAAGNLRPARGFGSLHSGLTDTNTRTAVTCAAGGMSATKIVDMSAWSIDLIMAEWHPFERDGVMTVYVDLRKRLNGLPPATSMHVDWGDGTRDQHPSPPIESPVTMLHYYKREGFYQATATVTWNGGSASQTRTVYGGPYQGR